MRLDAAIACAMLVIGSDRPGSAQSTAATLAGTVLDSQGQAAPGAVLTITSLETGHSRETTTDEVGKFRLLTLPPGDYELRVELRGFAPQRRVIALTVADDARVDVVLQPAPVTDAVVVPGTPARADRVPGVVGRTIVQHEIDNLPVLGRFVSNLAALVPGIVVSQGRLGPLISALGQTGRANTALFDGLSLDDTFQSLLRGFLPLDAVREFAVLTNGFTAEYGQASGAVLSAVTRSGTNRFAGRVAYSHRDDRLGAPPATVRFVSSVPREAGVEQRAPSGFIGGPLVRDRAFFFVALDATRVDSDFVFSTPLLRTHRPDAATSVPTISDRKRVFGRGDMNHWRGRTLVHYRFDQPVALGTFPNVNSGKNTPESRFDSSIRNQDVGMIRTRAWDRRANELRLQFGYTEFRSESDNYCAASCPSFVEDRPGLTLGASVVQSRGSRTQWQMNDVVSWVTSGRTGEHLLSSGAEARFVDFRSREAANMRGSFTFRTDAAFDVRDARTYPVFYSQNVGSPDVSGGQASLGVFVQDRWVVDPRLTLNLGGRWDYNSLRAVSRDGNNIAPRLGAAFGVERARRTTIRASYGHYYDHVPFAIVQDFELAQQMTLVFVSNPGYPDWRGPNPNRAQPLSFVPANTRQLAGLRTPYVEQASAGVRRASRSVSVSVDGVWAHGRNLLVTHDLNAPDANGRRPDPRYQLVRAVESRGQSWYRGLSAGMVMRSTSGHTASVGYTLSRAERDTEEYDFTPQDQRDFAAERGPAASDVRHQLSVSGTGTAPFAIRLGVVVTARTAAPYSVTTGIDQNRDGTLNDRPAGVGRNSARGSAFVQIDTRVSKSFGVGRVRLDIIGEVFNLLNRANWTAYDGVQASTTFGRPVAAAIARQIQLGARMDF